MNKSCLRETIPKLTTRGSVLGLGRQGKVSRRKVVISRSSWQAAIFREKGHPHFVGLTVSVERIIKKHQLNAQLLYWIRKVQRLFVLSAFIISTLTVIQIIFFLILLFHSPLALFIIDKTQDVGWTLTVWVANFTQPSAYRLFEDTYIRCRQIPHMNFSKNYVRMFSSGKTKFALYLSA